MFLFNVSQQKAIGRNVDDDELQLARLLQVTRAINVKIVYLQKIQGKIAIKCVIFRYAEKQFHNLPHDLVQSNRKRPSFLLHSLAFLSPLVIFTGGGQYQRIDIFMVPIN